MLLAACPLPGGGDDDDSAADSSADDDDSAGILPEALGELSATNSAGRTGAWFLPERGADESLPAVLLFHPTGGTGAAMRDSFLDEARARRFAIVAPDSRISPGGDATWEVGTEPGEVTPDLSFAQDCLQELLDRGLLLDSEALLAAGHSGGASSAPYLATADDRFTDFAVLHGGVFTGGLGEHRPRAWLSTGEDDSIRPPSELSGHAASLEALGFDVTLTLFPGGHGVGEQEQAELLDWWLD